MVYQGSKVRIRKYIVPILQKCIDNKNIKKYIECFVGGANVIDQIKCETRIGNDINNELIELLTYMQKDNSLSIFPTECSFEHYKDVRENRKNKGNKYSTCYTAGIGYFASFGGRYFGGGYAKNKDKRNYFNERLENAKEQATLLKDIIFTCKDYSCFSEYKNCVFYLDPPYINTKEYDNCKSFDYEKFYDFCRELGKDNYVFISEYTMPEDFKCIWEKDVKVTINSDKAGTKNATEKLFTIGLSSELN